MSGLSNILNELKKDSDALIKETIANAEKEAEKIIEEAKASGKSKAEEIIKNSEKKASEIITRAHSSANLSVKKEILKKKSEIIDGIISDAKEKICLLESKEYFEILINIVLKNCEKGGEIILSEEDKAALNKDFLDAVEKKGAKVSSKTLSKGEKGLIIDYKNVEENFTFTKLFESKNEELKDKILASLFD